MKFIKLFVISIVVLFGLLTVFSSLLPSRVRISRAVDINSPADRILEKINNMNEWDQWNEYTRTLPEKKAVKDSISSPALAVFITSSDSNSVATNWRQQNKKAFPGFFIVSPGTRHSTVQWYFEFTVKWYPWEKFGTIIYDKELGPQMQKSLQNLKDLLEKAP